jgi:hypothetical protein
VPVSWNLEEAAGLVTVEYTAPCTFDEWRSVIEQVRRNPTFAFQRRIGVLSNRALLAELPPWLTQSMATYVSRYPGILRGRRIALVVNDEHAYGEAGIQATMCEEAGARSQVFYSERIARIWLAED